VRNTFVDFLPKVKIETVVAKIRERAVAAIRRPPTQEKFGGRQSVCIPVEAAVRIRTGEKDEEAIKPNYPGA